MKNYVITGMIATVLMVLLAVGVTAAVTVTINVPASGTLLHGNPQSINVSIAGSTGEGNNVTNVSFYYKKSSDTTWSIIGRNNTYNLTSYNIGWNTFNLSDDSTYDINATALNESGVNIGSAKVTGFGVDNTVPICSQSTLVSGTEYDPKDTTTVKVTATNASRCDVNFGNNYYTFTESSDSCTFTLSQIPEGAYSVQFRTGDPNNLTLCTALTGIEIQNPSTSVLKLVAQAENDAELKERLVQQSVIPAEDTSSSSNKGMLIIIAIAIVVLIILNSKKK